MDPHLILTVILGLTAVIGPIVAYKYNPRIKIQKELDGISKEVSEWEKTRDEAISKNNADNITITVNKLEQLRARQTVLLQRYGQS